MAQGRAEGVAQGKAEGEAKGKVEALLTVLHVRGLALTDAQAERIRAEREIAVLDAWITRAAVAGAIDEVLASR